MRLDLTLDNRLAAIAEAAEAIEAFCAPLGIPRKPVRQLTLALDELLTNVIAYAWPPGGVHHVKLALIVAESTLTAEIIDDGAPFDPRGAAAPDLDAPIEARRVGGLGVHLATTLVDRIDYRRVGGENRVTLVKTFEPREDRHD